MYLKGGFMGTENSYINFDSQLGEWSQKMQEFKGRLIRLNEDARPDAVSKINELESKYQTALQRIRELKNNDTPKDGTKVAFESAWKELLHAFEVAKSSFM